MSETLDRLSLQALRSARLPRPLPDALDLPGDGAGRPAGQRRSRHRAEHHAPVGRHDLDPDRPRADPDDVPAAGEGPLRGVAAGLPQHEDSRHLAPAQLGDRSPPDVRARPGVPGRQARVRHRADPDRARTLHRDGHRLERPGTGRHRVCGGAGRLQLAVPGVLLLGLRLRLREDRSALDRSRLRSGGPVQDHDRRHRPERLHLPGHPLPCRDDHPVRPAAGQGDGTGTSRPSSRRSARSR